MILVPISGTISSFNTAGSDGSIYVQYAHKQQSQQLSLTTPIIITTKALALLIKIRDVIRNNLYTRH